MGLLAHGAVGICPLELLGLMAALASLGGVTGLVAVLRSKLGL